MTTIHAQHALLAGGWEADVRMELRDGRIAAITAGVAPEAGDERHAILVSGMPNLHSHAFQRGMAGLAEIRGPGVDSFWSWRETMYRFALSMTPDDVAAVAAQLYVEMLEAGFSRVGEFHYLHHDTDGRAYADIAEMAASIASAAATTGIGLTLLPVFYAHSGFGGTAPSEGQRRFINDLDGFSRLLDGCTAALKPLPTAVLGVAAHSLRAATPEELATVSQLRPNDPMHIHIAEQVKEVDDCLAWSGQRPVEWLLANAALDSRWCLIHATHMTPDETQRFGASGAVAGLCPITEANLGDGTYRAGDFLAAGGQYGVGSDSNVLIGVADELRQLEYSLRLERRSRNVLAAPGASTGRAVFDAALAGGATALGAGSAALTPGAAADFASLDAEHPALLGKRDDQILDSWIFGASRPAIDSVWVGGVKLVEHGRHRDREAIYRRFKATTKTLAERH